MSMHRVRLATTLGSGKTSMQADVVASIRTEAKRTGEALLRGLVSCAERPFATLAADESLTCSVFPFTAPTDDDPEDEGPPPSTSTDTRASLTAAMIAVSPDTLSTFRSKRAARTRKFYSTAFVLEFEMETLVCDLVLVAKTSAAPEAARKRAVKMIIDFVAAMPGINVDDIAFAGPRGATFSETLRLIVNVTYISG